MTVPLSRRLKEFAGFLLLVAVVVAPWAYGGTRTEGMWLIGWILLAAGLCGLAGLVLAGGLPDLPIACWGTSLVLIVLTWALFFRGERWMLDQTSLDAVAWNLQRWPTSVTFRPPLVLTLLATGLLASLVIVADLSREKKWRRRFLFAMAGTGATIAAFGIAQTLLGAETIFWQAPYGDKRDVVPGHFFSTFFHHSIAAAFLNLVWPLAAGLALSALARREGGDRLASLFWGIAAAAGLVAVSINVSKAGAVFALVLIVLLWLWPGRLMLKQVSARQKSLLGAGAALLILLGALALHQSGRSALIRERWEAWIAVAVTAPAEISQSGANPADARFDRFAGAEVGLKMLAESGLWGFGPGAWMKTFPRFMDGRPFEPFWLWMQFAHQDYLQIAIEWGLVAAALWAVLALGGLGHGITALRRWRRQGMGENAILLFSILLVLSILLVHAMADFPLQIPSIQVYAAMLLGMAWSAPGWDSVEERPIE